MNKRENITITKEDILQHVVENILTEKSSISKITTSKTPLNLRGNISVIEKSENKRIIAGYASIAVVDLEEQFIPIETLKNGINSLLKDPHYSNLMLIHKNIQIGKILESYNDFKTRVDDKGLFIVAEIRKDIDTANEVWESILNKDFNGFSIGCEVLSHHQECEDEKCVTVLDKINIFEVSVCSKPVNQDSGFVIISKSEFEDPDSVCKKCVKKIDNMSKEKSLEIEKETPKEEKEEPKKKIVQENSEEEQKETEEEVPKEKSIDEKLADITRSLDSISGLLQELAETPEEEEEEPEEEPEEYIEEESKKEKTKEEEPKEEEKGAPWGSMDPKNQESKTPPKSPNNPDDWYPKKAFDDLKKTMESLKSSLDKFSEFEDLRIAVKARDDQIESLKVELAEKSKESEETPEPKTVQEESKEEETPLESSFVVRQGRVYQE